MSPDSLAEHWALWVAVIPGALVLLYVTRLLRRRSSGGQLSRAVHDHELAKKELHRAHKNVDSATSRLEKLSGRAGRVKPRVLQESKDALEDALALVKIADDKAQVTANHVRRVIYEEFPPSKHEKLRKKHLPEDIRDNRPFSF